MSKLHKMLFKYRARNNWFVASTPPVLSCHSLDQFGKETRCFVVVQVQRVSPLVCLCARWRWPCSPSVSSSWCLPSSAFISWRSSWSKNKQRILFHPGLVKGRMGCLTGSGTMEQFIIFKWVFHLYCACVCCRGTCTLLLLTLGGCNRPRKVAMHQQRQEGRKTAYENYHHIICFWKCFVMRKMHSQTLL